MNIHTERMDFLSQLLNAATMRHDVIAQNIANVNTPGFQTLAVSFEEMLQQASGTTAEPSASSIPPQIVPGTGGIERSDGNNVDVDQEVARLQKNTLLFKVYTQVLATEIAQMRSAISGR